MAPLSVVRVPVCASWSGVDRVRGFVCVSPHMVSALPRVWLCMRTDGGSVWTARQPVCAVLCSTGRDLSSRAAIWLWMTVISIYFLKSDFTLLCIPFMHKVTEVVAINLH